MSNLSSESSSRTSTPSKQRGVVPGRSMGALNSPAAAGISIDPSGGGGGTSGALNQTNRSESVNTLESEKSCY